jgi:hypothetical protein
MPSTRLLRTAARVAERLPGLKRIPMLRLLMLADVVMLARDHLERLTPAERRRLVVLVRDGRGRKRNLSPRERDELEALVAKADPKLFASEAAERLSPVPLPKRFRPSD